MTELRHVLITSALASAGTLAIVAFAQRVTSEEETSTAGAYEGRGVQRAKGKLISLEYGVEPSTRAPLKPAEQDGIRAAVHPEGPLPTSGGRGPSPTNAWGATGTPEALFDDYRGPMPAEGEDPRQHQLQALRQYIIGASWAPYSRSLETELRKIQPFLRAEGFDTQEFWGHVAVVDAELADFTLDLEEIDKGLEDPLTKTARKLLALIKVQRLAPQPQ